MNAITAEILCDKYRLPENLIPLYIEQTHQELSADFKLALRHTLDAQIKWCLRRGWKPPELLEAK